MRTDPRGLDGKAFDLLVIGGGIQGAAIAREAAARGLQTLLVESRDFAGGTSSRSSRLVHGGLRYLQQAHVGLVREALHERERLLRLCPHLVRPLPMLLPFFSDGGGSRLLAWLGVRAYSWLSGRSTMPGPRKLTPTQAVAAFPGLREQGLRGGVLYYDAATVDARLTLANVEAAARCGALVVNHCEAVGLAGDRGVLLRDRITGADLQVRARHVINAAGPRADAVRRLLGQDGPDLVKASRGTHVILDPRPGETALAAFLPDGRIQFVVPHQDGTVCGTTDVYEEATEEEPTVPSADIDYLMSALGFLLEPAPRREDLRFAYCGWRSLPAGKGPAGALNREAFLVQERLPDGDLHTAVGGKLTTHRAFAERCIAQVFGFDGRSSPTRTTPLPGGGGPQEPLDPLWRRHGGAALALRAQIDKAHELGAPICPHRPLLAVEARHALQELGAVTFAHLMVRRLIHAMGPCLLPQCLRAAHELFLRHRRFDVDSDFEAARAALVDEVKVLSGGIGLPPGL